MIKCWEIMRRPLCNVTTSSDLVTVARSMRDERVGFFPVTDDAGRTVGVVTDRDIVIAACAEGRTLPETRVSEIMSRDVVTCSANDDLSLAINLMKRHQKSRIIIVDERRGLIGVLSMTDIAQFSEPHAVSSLLRAVSAREFRVSSTNSWAPPV